MAFKNRILVYGRNASFPDASFPAASFSDAAIYHSEVDGKVMR